MEICIRQVGQFLYIPVPHRMGRFFDYLGRDWANSPDPKQKLTKLLKQRLPRRSNFIIANECFLPSGIRKNKIFREMGDTWIKDVAVESKEIFPGTKLWINDFRPRELMAWQKLRDYIKEFEVPIDGIGIQVHAQLNPVLPTHFSSIQNTPELLEYQINKCRELGLEVAFTEVTCWSSDQEKRGEWYKKIYELALKHDLSFINFWSPTPAENWHWRERHPPPSHLWDSDGNWLFNWSLDNV